MEIELSLKIKERERDYYILDDVNCTNNGSRAGKMIHMKKKIKNNPLFWLALYLPFMVPNSSLKI